MSNTSKVAGIFSIVLFLISFTADEGRAIDIFVWHHDNNLRIIDPVFEQSFGVNDALTLTLEQLELEYTRSSNLPDDLENYDVVIVSLGFSCDT